MVQRSESLQRLHFTPGSRTMSESPLLQAVRGMQVSDSTAAEQSEPGEASASRRGPFTNGDVACVHGLNGRPDLN